VAAAAVFTATLTAAADGDNFFFDYAVFQNPPFEKARVEVYFAVPLESLAASSNAAGDAVYVFNVGASLVPVDGGPPAAEKVVSRTATVAAGDAGKSPLTVGQILLEARPGEYTLRVGWGDVLAGRSSVAERVIILTAPPAAGVFVSAVELAGTAAAVDADGGEFYKNGFYVVPNPTKVIDDREPTLTAYYEIYRLPADADTAVTVVYDIAQPNGRRVLETTRSFAASGPNVARAETFDITGLGPGRYVLTARVVDAAGVELATVAKDFVIYHGYRPDGSNAAALFTPYSQEDETRIRKEIGLIAGEDELAAFDALPPEEKPIFVDNFWARRDPDKDTPENEFKNEFYKLYRYAEDRFRTPFRDGVDTDRGRIYMRFGPPDEILTNPMGSRSETGIDLSAWSSEPFEAWEYYRAGGVDSQYVMFVFVDRNGDGDYDLDSSTLAGYGTLIRPNRGG
jgi:GWxTD domain-containing protein